MKVLILGGCGHMGSSTARELIKYEEVTHITLADIKVDLTKAHESVRSSKKVSTVALDVADFETLVTALKANDVVINDSAPYSKLGVSTVEAAIEAGVSYIDICDDCRVTQRMFELDESAKNANVADSSPPKLICGVSQNGRYFEYKPCPFRTNSQFDL